jgi:hypothetical protein
MNMETSTIILTPPSLYTLVLDNDMESIPIPEDIKLDELIKEWTTIYSCPSSSFIDLESVLQESDTEKWTSSPPSSSLTAYWNEHPNKKIVSRYRFVLVNYLKNVVSELAVDDSSEEKDKEEFYVVLIQGVCLLDVVLSKIGVVHKSKLQKIGCACLWIVWKLYCTFYPSSECIAKWAYCTKKKLLETELFVLQKLEWKLTYLTLYEVSLGMKKEDRYALLDSFVEKIESTITLTDPIGYCTDFMNKRNKMEQSQ